MELPARELVVVGAGAAGLWAAARAAELGRDVLLLEKTPRTGTKVLASGGTRCNLTTTLGPEDAARLFGPRGERFLRPAFAALPPRAVRERFAELGVPTVEAPLEKVFPESQRARDVRDALERWARAAGVEIRCGAPVRWVVRDGGEWRVALEDGSAIGARTLFLCPGGASVPRTGTTGDGYRWLAALGLPLVEPVPALVPLASPARWVRELSGIHLQEVSVRLRADGRVLGERARPIVFTQRGISGPGAMDLAEPVARAEARRSAGVGAESSGASSMSSARVNDARAPSGPLALVLDCLPGIGREELRARVIELAGSPGAPLLANALAEATGLPRRLVQAALGQAGCAPTLRVNELGRAERHALVEGLKGLEVPVDGTLGFDAAEVTAGGLALDVLDPRTLRVRGHEGLFVFGEVIDLSGPIGGLNFQAAFSTAELAARAASESP